MRVIVTTGSILLEQRKTSRKVEISPLQNNNGCIAAERSGASNYAAR